MVRISIGINDNGQRLDRFLRKYLKGAPLSYIYKIVRKDAKVNGKRRPRDYMLEEGDELCLYISEEDLKAMRSRRDVTKIRKAFRIAYEDQNILVADKPQGMLTHGDSHEKKDHLTNQVISYLAATGGFEPDESMTFQPAPAGRLDRNTGGLVPFGKNAEAQRALVAMYRENGALRKIYRTIVYGELTEALHLTGMMEKDEEKNRSVLSDKGKSMITDVRPLFSAMGYTVCRVELGTGRTHQIRLQLSEAGYPILGDPKYGDLRVNKRLKEEYGLSVQLLQAEELVFCRPEGVLEYLKGKSIKAGKLKIFTAIEKAMKGQEKK